MYFHGSPTFIVACVALGFVSHAIAQVDHSMHGKPAARAGSSAAETTLADGVVKKIDKDARRLTIAHDKLPNGMPAMTMTFRVKDTVVLDRLRVDQKIRFATERADSMLVVHLEIVQ